MLKHLFAAIFNRSAPAVLAGPAKDNQGQDHELVLYKFDACPYCQRVLHFLKKNPIPVTFKDTRELPAHREALIALGGKPQVPCLVVDGEPLYESGDIVSYLKSHYL